MKKYKALNYFSFISLPTEDEKKPIAIENGILNTLEPGFKMITMDEIRYINMMSHVISTGRIQFDPKDEDEVYKELEIDKNSVLKAEDVVDMIANPTKEKLEKICEIDNLNTIDLFRGYVISLRNMDNEDISNRVLSVINKRRDEIYMSPSAKTSIKIKLTTAEKQAIQEQEKRENEIKEVEDKYKEEIKKLKAELEKAKKSTKTTTRTTKTTKKEDEEVAK